MKLFLSPIMLLSLAALTGCGVRETIVATPSLDLHQDGDRTTINTRGQAEACKQERYAALPDDPSLSGYADRIAAIQRECDQAAEAALAGVAASIVGATGYGMAGPLGSGMGAMAPGMLSGMPGLQPIMLPDGVITPSIALEHYPGNAVPINIQGSPGASSVPSGTSQQDLDDLGRGVVQLRKELCDMKMQQGKPCK